MRWSPCFRYLAVSLVLAVAVLVVAAPSGTAILADDGRDTAAARPDQAELDARIAGLIEQLGAAEYPVREKAKNELQRLGLSAFDALNEAQDHRDLEIGMQARYLLRSAQVAWVHDTDPPEVKSILKGYGQLQEQERKTRIERLAKLEDRKGWNALCRLSRYETEEILSKQAALEIIKQRPTEAKNKEEAAQLLEKGVAQSKRRATQWLRTYAHSLRNPEAALPEWDRLLNDEFELLASQEAKTSVELITSLARWHVESLHQLKHADAVPAVVKRLVALLDGTPEKLAEHVDWLSQQEMWSYVVELYPAQAKLFDDNPMLLYRLAEAQRRLNDEAATATAKKALALNDVNNLAHIRAGFALAERGLFDWAEAEYRAVLKEELVNRESVQARLLLSEMLHDQQRELDAAQVLEPLVQAIDKKEAEGAIENLGRDPGGIKSRMHYFFALDLLSHGKTDEATKHLNQGAEADPSDADVLIALFRLPKQTDEQRGNTRRLIREATEGFQEQILNYARELAESQIQNEALSAIYKQQLAMAHNQLAWLVANTEGDFDAAIASSHESLKLRPETGAYYDTLGSCYYAKGDLQNAIKYQTEALRLDPHSGQMKRQLAKFKQAAEKNAEKK
jgi:Flp pilus assembly protein TadD